MTLLFYLHWCFVTVGSQLVSWSQNKYSQRWIHLSFHVQWCLMVGMHCLGKTPVLYFKNIFYTCIISKNIFVNNFKGFWSEWMKSCFWNWKRLIAGYLIILLLLVIKITMLLKFIKLFGNLLNLNTFKINI